MRAWSRRAGLLLAVFALTACTGGGGGRSQAPADVRIGILTPLTGQHAAAGREALQGAELAVRLINDGNQVVGALTGGDGLDGQQFTLISADTASSPPKAASAAAGLVAQERVAGLVGAYDLAATAAASQRTDRLGVPFVNGDTSAGHLTERGLDWFFRVGPTDRMLGESLFSVLQQQQATGVSTRRVAILHPNDKQGVDVAATVRELAGEGGFTVAAAAAFRPGSADLTPAVARVRDADPDAVFLVASTSADAARLAGAFAQLNYTPGGLLALGDGFASPTFARDARGDAEGVFRGVAWSQELASRNPTATAVMDAYQQAYNQPMTQTAAGSFMAVLTLARGIDASQGQGAEQVRTRLTTLSAPGRSTIAPWNGIQFDATHQNAAAAGVVEQIRSGTPRVVFPREVAREAPVWPLARLRDV